MSGSAEDAGWAGSITPDLGGSVVLVTGGTRGLGAGLARGFAQVGAQVAICGRHDPRASGGGEGAARPPVDGTTGAPDPVDRPPAFFACDVREPDQAASLVRQVVERFGRLDVLVNNAGGSPYTPSATTSPAFFTKIVALNLLAPFYVAQEANRVMQAQEHGGVILNIGSIVSFRPHPLTSAYNAAKAGLVTLTRSLALEWSPKVRVNCVTSGLLHVENAADVYGDDLAKVEATIPMGRLAEPSDVAGACILLASPLARYVTGAELIVDGGGEVPAFVVATGGLPRL